MKRSVYLVVVLLGLLLLASMFAPTPWMRTVQAGQSSACEGLNRAYAACLAHNTNFYACEHIRAQLIALGCSVVTP
jgi:hypothetical protein